MKFIVAQVGARMHYAVPRLLHASGMLERFYTDLCAVKDGVGALRMVPAFLRPPGLRRLLGRIPHGVPPERITTAPCVAFEFARRRAFAKNRSADTAAQMWVGDRLCQVVLDTDGLKNAQGAYTFNGAGHLILKAARECGVFGVVEQTMAPRLTEEGLLHSEIAQFPDWESPLDEDLFGPSFCERERMEWECADLILCGSEFVRESIAACHGPVERCRVVPYGVDHTYFAINPNRMLHGRPLRVLTVGTIGLRKGAPYVLAAARQLKGMADFRMAGPIEVLPEAERQLRADLELTGQVPRSEILKHYAWADVFLLPSLCEGSATVVYEALAAGLPVICTPNTGSVVRDGVDGFIVPIRDSQTIAKKLSELADSPAQLAEMSQNARRRAVEFSLQEYRRRLVDELSPKP